MSQTGYSRLEGIAPFHVMKILACAQEMQAAGHDVIHLEAGEPDFPNAPAVIKAGQKALLEGKTKYTAAQGIPELRTAIKDWYHQRYALDIDPRRIIVTPGSSVGLQMVLSHLLNAGDSILLTDPGYPCNPNYAQILNSRAEFIPLSPDNGWKLKPDAITTYWQADTQAVLVGTPANPTGAVLSLDELDAVYQRVSAQNGSLIVDEVYQGINYEQPSATALSLNADNIYIINSFSKYFCMTGWRIGWLVVPEDAIETISVLAENLYLSPPTVSQYAAISALQPESTTLFDQQIIELKTRRDLLIRGLEKLGFGIVSKPAGAFYVYANCSKISQDSALFCQQLLEKSFVALTPGVDFTKTNPNQWVRFAYTVQQERIEEALERIEHFLSTTT